MANISFGGLGNGLDFGQVVDQLVKAQRLPIDTLQAKKNALQTKLTEYGTLGTKLLAVQAAAEALHFQTSFDRTSSTVSDEDVMKVTSSSTAGAGSYRLQVTQLAAAHQIASKAAKSVAAASTDIVAGASATFSFQVGTGAVQTVNLGADATLEQLRDEINNLGAGATASIVNTGTPTIPAYRLLLTASTTGAASAITVTADTTSLDFANGTGTGGSDTLQAAQNAVVVLGDPSQTQLTIQRDSNTLTDVIPGVTMNLKRTTSVGESVTVGVSVDVGKVQDSIKNLATTYNDLVKFVNERTTYDQESKKGGPLFGEGTVRSVISTVRSALGSTLSGVSGPTSVGEVGFKTEKDGTITLDEGKLSSALSTNYAGVKELFTSKGPLAGIGQRVGDAVDTLDDVQAGALTARQKGITGQLQRMTDDIQRKEDTLTAYEARLRAQFASLDGLLRQMQTQSNYLKSRG
ncbi:MAG: flagellar filament capping protein FliD [Nitrospiraceae bacterium]